MESSTDRMANFGSGEIGADVMGGRAVVDETVLDLALERRCEALRQSNHISRIGDVHPGGETPRPATHTGLRSGTQSLENQVSDPEGRAQADEGADGPVRVSAERLVRDDGSERVCDD